MTTELKPLTQPIARTDLVLWESITTSDGNALKTTLVDSSLITYNDFLTNTTLYISSGSSNLETRDITGFSTVTGTITVGTAFSAQIVSGVHYKVLAVMPADIEVSALQADVGNASASTLASLYGILGNPSASLATTILDGIDGRANNPTLNALLGVTDASGRSINGNIGDFQAQTNLQTLLAALGIPDTAAKPLYTCLITDRLDNATYGLSAIETLVDDLEGSVGAIEGATTLHNKLTAARAGYLDFMPSLYYGLVSAVNQATGGGASTITLTAGASAVNDFYKGMIISLYAGAGAGQGRAIVAYDGVTKIATVSPSWATNPDATSYYVIITAGSAVISNPATRMSIQNYAIDLATAAELGTGYRSVYTDARAANLDNIALTAQGKARFGSTVISLNQAAGTYDLFLGTTQDVMVEKLVIRMPDSAAGGALTSISIQTDDSTPQVFISSTTGAVANLTAQAQISKDAPIIIAAGKKIQLTIAGGAHGSAYSCTVYAFYRAVVSGGSLA